MPLPLPDLTTVQRHDPMPEDVRRIVDALEIDIVLGRLVPRERLLEEEIAAHFGAKRHIVRQAFMELERIGMIDRKRNRGAAVRDFRPEDVEDLYAVREILETSAAALITFPVDEHGLEDLIASQHEHDAALTAGDPVRVFRANNVFHRKLFALCRNAYLAEVIEDFAQRTHAIRSYSVLKPEYGKQAREEHWSIIEALKSSDRDQLATLCRDHLNISKKPYIESWRARFPEQEAHRPQQR